MQKVCYPSWSQGSGTFITNQKLLERSTNIKSFTEEMQESGKQASTEILEFKIEPASEEIAKRKLSISRGDPVYYIKRLRKADNISMMLETNYIDVKSYPSLSYEDTRQSKYQFVEKTTKQTIDRSHHIVVPIMPDDETVRHFGCTIHYIIMVNESTLASFFLKG